MNQPNAINCLPHHVKEKVAAEERLPSQSEQDCVTGTKKNLRGVVEKVTRTGMKLAVEVASADLTALSTLKPSARPDIEAAGKWEFGLMPFLRRLTDFAFTI